MPLPHDLNRSRQIGGMRPLPPNKRGSLKPGIPRQLPTREGSKELPRRTPPIVGRPQPGKGLPRQFPGGPAGNDQADSRKAAARRRLMMLHKQKSNDARQKAEQMRQRRS